MNPEFKKLPTLNVSQEELKKLVSLSGIMCMGIHYGVDPSVSVDVLPKEIEENGGMLGLMMGTIRASEMARKLIAEIVERAENAESDKLHENFQKIVDDLFPETDTKSEES